MKSFVDSISPFYKFKNKNLLLLALTHRSAKTEIAEGLFKNQTNNEQLEFVGDGLLNFIVAEELMSLYPKDDEGLLSKKRAHLVDQKTLAQKALDLAVDQFLVLGPGEREQESHKKPRVLASALEAVIAAVYYDSDLKHTQKFVLRLLQHNIFEVSSLSFDKDYKTQLQELTQQRKLGLPVYKELSTKGPSHDPEFLIALEINNEEMARATGPSKKKAEQLAAEKTYKQLNEKVENEPVIKSPKSNDKKSMKKLPARTPSKTPSKSAASVRSKI